MPTNTLYYGDNLRILHDHVKDESVDLIYLDPPFNSNASYNILFKEQSGKESAAQIHAFEDTWHWGPEAESAFAKIMDSPLASATTKKLVGSLRETLGDKTDMTAYLVMMAVRLLELHRVLKPTGTLYLHCDPTASHYLKLLLDSVFGPTNFRNEIIWRRTGSHNSSRRFGPMHDVILFYSKTDNFYFQRIYRPYQKGHVEGYFKQSDTRGRFWTNALTGAGTRKGESGQPWHDYNPTSVGRHWAIPGRIAEELGFDDSMTMQQKLEAMDAADFISHPPSGSTAMPTYRQYLKDSPGMPIQDIWAYQPHTQGLLYESNEGIDEDVRWFVAQGDTERLGYPTQKPVGLLERIISSSCRPDGVVLDPFCGCGTSVVVAEGLGRQWIGIDITHLAVALMKSRLKDMFNQEPRRDYQVVGEPVAEADARQLWQDEPFQFQCWAVSLVTGQPRQKEKRGPDRGIDGVIFFLDGPRRTAHQAIIQVKGGKVGSPQLRDLKGVVEREKAAFGFFICLDEPTRDMRAEAVSGGFFHSDLMGKDYPKVQLRTVAELLSGKGFDMPLRPVQFKQAERVRQAEGSQGSLALG